MNGRQAAKEAAKHIENLENYNNKAMRDIKAYNECIDNMIQGGNPCDWCEEKRLGECEHPECDGKGCESWWLKDLDAKEPENTEPEKVESIITGESPVV